MEGQLVRLVPHTQQDMQIDNQRAIDNPELAMLDPYAGAALAIVQLSIKALAGGHHLGICILYNLEGDTLSGLRIQLGIRITDKLYWDNGYGTEAVKLLVDYGFTYLNISSIWLKVLPENIRAVKCYEKCGFVQSGQLSLAGYDFITMEVTRGRV